MKHMYLFLPMQCKNVPNFSKDKNPPWHPQQTSNVCQLPGIQKNSGQHSWSTLFALVYPFLYFGPCAQESCGYIWKTNQNWNTSFGLYPSYALHSLSFTLHSSKLSSNFSTKGIYSLWIHQGTFWYLDNVSEPKGRTSTELNFRRLNTFGEFLELLRLLWNLVDNSFCKCGSCLPTLTLYEMTPSWN